VPLMADGTCWAQLHLHRDGAARLTPTMNAYQFSRF
jgi:hypothetical protein